MFIYVVDVNFRILDINLVIYEWWGKLYVVYIENVVWCCSSWIDGSVDC